ncbi:pyridine nucleotide-disulfide oxidoreductase domain-containing protein 1-like [Dysidea avara]|uniref:pyridine nucleotide-disulfide oxidoreductase domain-containing protein 1-like n=1 Tax=Dysidea avara TaxID=196820 RepID=UPI003327C86A
MAFRYVVVGGGIAGVSCAEQLSHLDNQCSITLISESQLIKSVTNFKKVTRALEDFEVTETSASHLTQQCPNVEVVIQPVTAHDPQQKVVGLANGDTVKYDKLCVCTGARPKLLLGGSHGEVVIGIRDTESVKDFQSRLSTARRILVVGNGGIATELVYEVTGCEVVWAIRDDSISSTFFDAGAATFFLPHLEQQQSALPSVVGGGETKMPLKRLKYMLDPIGSQENHHSTTPKGKHKGSALGPDWSTELAMQGQGLPECYRHVVVEYSCEVADILSPHELDGYELLKSFPTSKWDHISSAWPVYIKLTNGIVYGCDIIVSATGVIPNTAVFQAQLASDGGISVDHEMRSSCEHVYAAGDACSVQWKDPAFHWFQMRLWGQARQLGAFAANCMWSHTANQPIIRDFCFELFAHVTKFFGYKVVLLGRYNAQGLDKDYEMLLRCTKGMEYVKVILHHGKMVGAILIGETDLEETFENLILNQMDLSQFGEELLNPDVDIEDYFD